MRITIRSMLFLITVAGVLIFSIGCAAEPPEIRSVAYQLRYHFNPESGDVRSSIAVHVELADREQAEAIEELRLQPADSDLTWIIPADDLVIQEVDSRIWIGSNAASMPYNIDFPSGQFTVEVADMRGDQASAEFAVAEGTASRTLKQEAGRRFALITTAGIDEKRYLRIRNVPVQQFTVRIHDADGVQISAFTLDRKQLSATDPLFGELAAAEQIYISYIDLLSGAELISGPLTFDP